MSSFWLEYTQNGERRDFSFDAPTVSIGRDKSADFVLDHPTVSRQHALIVSSQRGYQLVVLSRGGLTAIDGGQVSGEVDLYDGSVVHFGQLSFVFRSEHAPARPAAHAQSAGGRDQEQFQSWSGAVSGSFQPVQHGGWQQSQPQSQQQQQHGGWQQPQQHQSGWNQAQGQAYGGGQQPANNGAGWQSEPSWDTGTDGWSEVGDEPSDGLVSWEQIAESAEAEEAKEQAANNPVTDFERMQAAQAKADAQSKGNNPLVVVGGTLAIVALLAFSFWPTTKPMATGDAPDLTNEAVFIEWQKNDIDCVGEVNCQTEALTAFQFGMSTWERRDADIVNRYTAYAALDKADRYLEKGGITEPPPKMAALEETKKLIKTELDSMFRMHRLNFREHENRKMYDRMADELHKIQAYFPDKRCQYHQWALQKERQMKDEGVYPRPVAL